VADLFSGFSNIFQTVAKVADQKVYLVGGAVRDALLNRPSHDLDFVVKDNARKIARRTANLLGGTFYMLDEARDTARVYYRAENGEKLSLDFATFRSESLEGDLRDRDFTINAIAVDIEEPAIQIDPTGGVSDLIDRQIRPCSSKSVSADPVRILRAVRLALTLGMRITAETETAIRAAVPLLKRVSAERQRDELFRILDSSPVDTAIRLLDRFGALAVILPELELLKGVTQSAPHVDDVWNHTLNAVQQLEGLYNALVNGDLSDELAASSPLRSAVWWLGHYRKSFRKHFETSLNPNRSVKSLLFFAMLYHDIGKPVVRSQEADGRVRFFEHDVVGAGLVEKRGRELSLSTVEVQRLMALTRHHMRIHHLADTHQEISPRAVYRYWRATGEAGVCIPLLSLADTLATYGATLPVERWESELEVCRKLLDAWWESPPDRVRPARLLTGQDLQEQFGLTPGPLIGELLEALQEAQATGEISGLEEAQGFIAQRLHLIDNH
jgi:poly(A) polymerase